MYALCWAPAGSANASLGACLLLGVGMPGRACGSLQACFLASFMKLLNSSLNLAYPTPTSTSTHQTKDHATWDGRVVKRGADTVETDESPLS